MKTWTIKQMKAGGFTTNNTIMTENEERMSLFLHGHNVAVWDKAFNRITLFTCGWPTVTTKKRMNQFLSFFGVRAGVSQKNFNWYCNGVEFVNGKVSIDIRPKGFEVSND